MDDLYTHIEDLGKAAGYKNMTQLCKAAHVSRAAMTEMKKGRSREISKPTAQKFADLLGVSLETIYLQNENPDAMVRAGADIIPQYYELSPEDRATVDALIARLATGSAPEH